MNGILKKALLFYLLFLFTTVSSNSSEAIEPPMPETKSAGWQFTGRQFEAFTLNEKAFIKEAAEPVKAPAAKKKEQVEEIVPVLLEIPKINVQTEVIKVGKTADGHMDTPKSIHTAGWYEPGNRPGAIGNAVLAGHVDGMSSPGVFARLKELEPGDLIEITGGNGAKLTFSVIDKESYLPENAPLENIFGRSSERRLNLITCSGEFNRSIGHYEERLVVYTRLVQER